jgi:hypothetical protein
LLLEQAQSTEGCCGMEDIAMLLFYLPIIIFEAMLEAQTNHGSVEPKCVRKDQMRDMRTHLGGAK